MAGLLGTMALTSGGGVAREDPLEPDPLAPIIDDSR
ncbi:hypothetical protein MRGA327_18840 [Mycobacterium tuberculosis RGTB327]|nr:hypothetical protein MRGA423_19085 [Mycobacterium tuberculosis RGTB423]AFE17867.1 hypothetical protein MRGA327_18840 [Mycobacterium tuberculosis RGTB327]AGJ69181.1 hypothetical protein J112_16410 [Mycobacterium tuberculosis str. Beijing/NITR203]AGL24641.1 hypothetical protein I917_21515 [Mycobacterium tuberculosis str. Haarlem/NITR202]AGL28511.1 hypothetical protein J113_21345 [Mycobacterium tuberculosis CAS/NITR204]AGL32566.1 hypothetical protein J114_16385 [Mycobacterium tuberculosis EAI5